MVGTLGCYENLAAAKEIPLLDLALTLKEGRRCLPLSSATWTVYLPLSSATYSVSCCCMSLSVLCTYCYLPYSIYLPLPALATCRYLPYLVKAEQFCRCLNFICRPQHS